MMKRALTLILAAMLMNTVCLALNVFAADTGETVTRLVNVAKNKPCVLLGALGGGTADAVNNDNMADSVIIPAAGTADKGTIGIDLQRRYPLEQIIIYDYDNESGIGSAARGQFEILCADTENIDEAKVIFELNDAENTEFVANGRYTITLGDKPVGRYVFYRSKVAGAMCAIREIQVFASVTAVEISRNAQTYTTSNLGATTMNGSKAVDGKFEDSNSMYLKVMPNFCSTIYSTFTADLGTPKYVDMIEMYGRPGITYNTSVYHGYFGLYGSNDGTVTDFSLVPPGGLLPYGEIDKAAFEDLTQEDGATRVYERLAQIPAGIRSYTTQGDSYTYDAFPDTTLASPKAYQTMLDSTRQYRYLTYRKTAANGAHMVYMSEFRAYQIKPEIYDIFVKNGKIIIDFSDEMDLSSVSNALSVKNISTGVHLASENISLNSEKPWQIVVTLPEMFNTAISVRITNEAENIKGAALDRIYEKKINLPKALEAESASFVDASGNPISSLTGMTEVEATASVKNNSSEPQKLLTFLCAYNASNTPYKIVPAEVTISPGNEAIPVNTEITLDSALGAGDYVVLHLWNDIEMIDSWMPMLKMQAE